jgi:hypothetical protein
MRKRSRYQVTLWHGESDSLFYITDTTAPSQDQPRIAGTFEGCPDLAQQCADALNAGASTYFVGAEFRQKTCLLHIKRREGGFSQSIVERHHGARLLSKLCQRHPLMIVDLFLVFQRCQMHSTYIAKDHLSEVSHEHV